MDVSVLETAIADFVREYQNREDIESVWGEPLVEELCLYRKNGTCGVCGKCITWSPCAFW